MAALGSSVVLGQERNLVYQKRTDRNPETVGANGDSARGRSTNRAVGWRYRYHNGNWWYYRTNGQWLYWTGNAWTPYAPAREGQTFSPGRADTGYGYGRRDAGTIQREKNEPRGEEPDLFETRGAGTIQREKNELRSPSTEGFIRPPGTIQHEKNDVRD